MAKRLLKREKVELLSQLALFETCTQRELGRIASISLQCHRPAGTVLTREGQLGGLLFIILEGEAEVLKGTRRISSLGPGDVIGELSLIDGQGRSASVRAVSDVELLEITDRDFTKLVKTSPKFVRNLLRALSSKVRQTESLSV